MKRIAVGLAGTALVIGGAFVYFGIFNVAADAPHSRAVHALLDAVRSRSVAVRAEGIVIPALEDAGRVRAGAAHYAEMCAGCHLSPVQRDSELRAGLYPQPPDLTSHEHATPAEMFWTIKHGIKMSGMPAWGKTHDDESIWDIVAFLQGLPELGPEEYEQLIRGHEHPAGGHSKKPASHTHGDHQPH